MSLSRTPPGLAAEHLFYRDEVLVYVEGQTDIPFYKTVLENYNCRIKTFREETSYNTLLKALKTDNPHIVIIVDGHYDILTRKRSQHRRLVFLHRHSYENYLIEKEPVEQFRHNRAHLRDSLEKLKSSFNEIVQETELKLKELLILDVANQRSDTNCKVLPKKADSLFVSHKTIDFDEDKIRGLLDKAVKCIDKQSIDNARSLVEEYLNEHRFFDLLPGHFAFSIITCWINRTVNIRKRILEEDISVHLSTAVWRSVQTRDHNSLKRRLYKAVREAEIIRQTSNS